MKKNMKNTLKEALKFAQEYMEENDKLVESNNSLQATNALLRKHLVSAKNNEQKMALRFNKLISGLQNLIDTVKSEPLPNLIKVKFYLSGYSIRLHQALVVQYKLDEEPHDITLTCDENYLYISYDNSEKQGFKSKLQPGYFKTNKKNMPQKIKVVGKFRPTTGYFIPIKAIYSKGLIRDKDSMVTLELI